MDGNEIARLVRKCLKEGHVGCVKRYHIEDLEGFQKQVESEILSLLYMHMRAGMEAKRRGNDRRPLLHLEVINDILCGTEGAVQSGASSPLS